MAKGNRIQRVSDLIQTALAEIIQRNTEDLHIGMVTITGVSISPDFSFAKVFVSVLDDANAENTIKQLNNSNKFLRYELAHAITLRITPELRFVYDDSTLRGSRISSLINTVLKNNQSHNDGK